MKKQPLIARLIAPLAIASCTILTVIAPTPSVKNSWATAPDLQVDFAHNRSQPKILFIAHREEQTLAVPEGKAIPRVSLIVHPDARKGWNLEVKVSNFKFTPEKVNQDGNSSEGHAHLYVNGKKITRIYGNWYYLASLEPGRNKVKVTLNANNHHTLTYKGNIIEDSQIIEVK